jgi:amino acid adenylation domain-containing protein
VTFGCPVADRDEETTAAVLGPCLNMIVVRSLCTPDTTLGELLRAIRGWLLDAFEYRDTPFEKVLRKLAPPRYADRAPYVDVTLNLPDSLPDAGRLGAASLSPLPFDEWDTGVKFGLTVSFTESGGAMRGVLSYHGDRFTRADTERMAGQLGQVLHRFPDLLDRPVLAMDTEGAGTPSPARQYRDVFDDEITARQRGPADLARVVGRLRGAPSALGFLPPGRPEPHGDVAVPMPDGTLGRLRSMGAADGVSWFMVVATALAQVLHRWTGSDDVAFCVPVSTRDTRSAQVIGPCLNTVVLRSVRAPGTTAQELLRSMRDAVLDAFEHRRVPFDAVVDALNPPRPPGRPPFLDVALVADVEPGFPASLGEATLTPLPPDHEGAAHVAKFGLTVSFAETGGRLTGSVLHHGDRFSRAEVTRMAGLLGRLLGRFPDILATPADALDLIGDEEREELTGFESGGPAIPAALVLDAVMLRCAEQPHAAAIVSDEGIVTYGELAVRARRLAATLRALVAGDEGDGELFVAVLLPRGCKLVIAMLAAWLAGCAFCPLEPDFPVSRIQSVLADLGARAVVTDDLTWAQRLAPVPVIAVSAAAPAAAATAAGDDGSTDDVARVDADATAYVLYTSGTTGSAKGVAYSHAALAAVIAWYVGTFSLTPADRVSQIHSTAFDMTQLELWSALTAGATLLPYQAPMILAPDLAEWVNERAVTVLCTPTSLAQALWFSGVPLRSLRWMFFAGSPLRQPPPEQLTYRVGDLYGPTETFITTAHILAPQSGAPVNCVGRPVAGDLVYVLDELGGRCPIGVPGEIHVGGIGVAKGYLGKPALTAERFADKDPDHRPGRIYRTGDRGRWLPDGRLEFLGRMDRQLKIRGYRVEPAEVEAHLLRDPLVRAAVAHQVGDDPAHLVGYLVPRTPGASDTDSVLTRLRQQLPDFMVPDAIVWLSELPMTVRGKVDPARLPHPERTDMAGPGPLVAPGNELERRIAKTWSDTLGVGRVGVSDSFFDLGGNSLLLAKLHLKLQADLGITLPIQRLLAFPTVRALAAALSAPDGATSSGGHSSSPQELRERAQRARQSSARRAAQRMGKP